VLSAPNIVATDLVRTDTATAVTASADPVRPGLVGIRAPLPGTFYRAPKPGADPYVEVGSHVEEDTVVGLLETMKLFNSVHANVRGEVVEFLVDDAQPANQDTALILVRPDALDSTGPPSSPDAEPLVGALDSTGGPPSGPDAEPLVGALDSTGGPPSGPEAESLVGSDHRGDH
jgi:biotin carboxyl carrier protein